MANKNIKFTTVSEVPERILAQVTTLLETTEGTVPYNRDFGINGDLIDLPYNQAQALITEEIINKMETYIPSITVVSVTIDTTEVIDGKMKIEVVISYEI